MKKIAIAALALTAATGIALAEVTSANIVGYQKFGGQGTFNFTAATFLPVGTDGSSMTLANLKGGESFEAAVDSINLYTSAGMFIDRLTYYPDDDPDDYGIDGGWYEWADFDNDEPVLRTDALPYGTGFVFRRANTAATVNYAGELKQEANTLPAAGTFNFTGNTSPVDITVAALSGNASFETAVDSINLYTAAGMFIDRLTYYPEGDPEGYGIEGGWYEWADFDNDEPVLRTDVIRAGEGFVFRRANSAARVIVAAPPSAQ